MPHDPKPPRNPFVAPRRRPPKRVGKLKPCPCCRSGK